MAHIVIPYGCNDDDSLDYVCANVFFDVVDGYPVLIISSGKPCTCTPGACVCSPDLDSAVVDLPIDFPTGLFVSRVLHYAVIDFLITKFVAQTAQQCFEGVLSQVLGSVPTGYLAVH